MALTTEQYILKSWLENHFISGRYYTIEEICENVVDKNGKHIFTLNENPYNHDKCIKLSNMRRKINWNCNDGYKIIIANEKGSIKLCENEKEFNEWKQHEMDKLLPKWQYLNNLKWKADRDGQVPIYNQALNENKDNKITKVYAKEKVVKSGKFAGMTMSELMLAGMKESFGK